MFALEKYTHSFLFPGQVHVRTRTQHMRALQLIYEVLLVGCSILKRISYGGVWAKEERARKKLFFLSFLFWRAAPAREYSKMAVVEDVLMDGRIA